MTIYLATDHAGYALKERIKEFLKVKKYEVKDVGAHSFVPTDDYPDYISLAAKAVSKKNSKDRAIIFGASGQGEAMVANRYHGVRCAVFYGLTASGNPYEIVQLSREHNNANMLSIGARFVSFEEAQEAIMVWLTTPFSHNERHLCRIRKF